MRADTAALDLADLTGYAVELRYDAEFWPDQPIATQAVALAERVRSIVVAGIPADMP